MDVQYQTKVVCLGRPVGRSIAAMVHDVVVVVVVVVIVGCARP